MECFTLIFNSLETVAETAMTDRREPSTSLFMTGNADIRIFSRFSPRYSRLDPKSPSSDKKNYALDRFLDQGPFPILILIVWEGDAQEMLQSKKGPANAVLDFLWVKRRTRLCSTAMSMNAWTLNGTYLQTSFTTQSREGQRIHSSPLTSLYNQRAVVTKNGSRSSISR